MKVTRYGVSLSGFNQVVAMLVRRCVAGDAAAWEEIVWAPAICGPKK